MGGGVSRTVRRCTCVDGGFFRTLREYTLHCSWKSLAALFRKMAGAVLLCLGRWRVVRWLAAFLVG